MESDTGGRVVPPTTKKSNDSCAVRIHLPQRGSPNFFCFGCLARIRSYLKNADFPRIIEAWKWSYAQIRTQELSGHEKFSL